jgi:hypothetical protein
MERRKDRVVRKMDDRGLPVVELVECVTVQVLGYSAPLR